MKTNSSLKFAVLISAILIACAMAVPPKNKLRSLPGDVLLNDFLVEHGIISKAVDEDTLETAREFVIEILFATIKSNTLNLI